MFFFVFFTNTVEDHCSKFKRWGQILCSAELDLKFFLAMLCSRAMLKCAVSEIILGSVALLIIFSIPALPHRA